METKVLKPEAKEEVIAPVSVTSESFKRQQDPQPPMTIIVEEPVSEDEEEAA